jgi:hypothetical protein
MYEFKRWVRPRQCTSFWAWLIYEWDFPCGWDGPYVQIRERGFRFFGFESIQKYRYPSD